jgi:hypothetical protein
MNIESVWENPRPPRLEPVPQRIRVRHRVCDSRQEGNEPAIRLTCSPIVSIDYATGISFNLRNLPFHF